MDFSFKNFLIAFWTHFYLWPPRHPVAMGVAKYLCTGCVCFKPDTRSCKVSPVLTLWEIHFYHILQAIPDFTPHSHLLSQWSLFQLRSPSPYDASLFWRLSIALIIPLDLLWTFLALLCFSWAQRAALPAGVHIINVHSNTGMRTGVFFFFLCFFPNSSWCSVLLSECC